MSRRLIVAALGLTMFASLPRSAEAQSRFEFTPFVGLYVPAKPLIADTSGGATIIETTSGPVIGGRVTYWVSPRVGLEGSFGLAASKTHLFAGSTEIDFRSTTYMADAKVLLQVTNPSAPTGLHLAGGVALTRASNSFFSLSDELDQLTYEPSIGFVLGAGVSRQIGSALRLRIDLEDRIYTAKFDAPGGFLDVDDEGQHDVVFSTGLSFGF